MKNKNYAFPLKYWCNKISNGLLIMFNNTYAKTGRHLQQLWLSSRTALQLINNFFEFSSNISDLKSPSIMKSDKLPKKHLTVQNNNRNTRSMCETYSKLTIKTPERRQ